MLKTSQYTKSNPVLPMLCITVYSLILSATVFICQKLELTA